MNYKYILLITASFLLLSCGNNSNKEEEHLPADLVNIAKSANGESKNNKVPVMQFEHIDFDFGLIYEGEEVVHKYKFKNVGNATLIISDVSASCGCTIPTFSKEPIKPGEEGFIEVRFDSSGRKGMQHKTVTVRANTEPNNIKLSFVAEIEVPK